MSDLISRSALLKRMRDRLIDLGDQYEPDDPYVLGFAGGYEYVNVAPAVDAVPVVRCVECKWRDTDVCARNAVYCTEFGEFMPYNGFCHKGAKMDGGTEG